MKYAIYSIILLAFSIGFVYYIENKTPSNIPMTTENKNCFTASNFTKVVTYLENKTPYTIDDFSLRIFEGSIVFDGKKGELLGSISKKNGIIPVVISGYDEMVERMNNTFCHLIDQSNR